MKNSAREQNRDLFSAKLISIFHQRTLNDKSDPFNKCQNKQEISENRALFSSDSAKPNNN